MNKQIEDVARDLCPFCEEYETCQICDSVLDTNIDPCVYKCFAEIMIAKNYRKQSEGEWIDAAIEQIIRKKAEVSEYWQNDVKQYRATQGYSDIEQDVDNFLRGYGEAVEDVIKILDGAKMKGGE